MFVIHDENKWYFMEIKLLLKSYVVKEIMIWLEKGDEKSSSFSGTSGGRMERKFRSKSTSRIKFNGGSLINNFVRYIQFGKLLGYEIKMSKSNLLKYINRIGEKMVDK